MLALIGKEIRNRNKMWQFCSCFASFKSFVYWPGILDRGHTAHTKSKDKETQPSNISQLLGDRTDILQTRPFSATLHRWPESQRLRRFLNWSAWNYFLVKILHLRRRWAKLSPKINYANWKYVAIRANPDQIKWGMCFNSRRCEQYIRKCKRTHAFKLTV